MLRQKQPAPASAGSATLRCMRSVSQIALGLSLRVLTPDLEPDLRKRYRGRVAGACICLFAAVFFLIAQVVHTWQDVLTTRLWAWTVGSLVLASQIALVRVAYAALRDLDAPPAEAGPAESARSIS